MLLVSCKSDNKQFMVSSPDNSNSVEFSLTDSGQPMYMVKHKDKTVIDSSLMSFDFKDLPSLKGNFKVVSAYTGSGRTIGG